MKQAIGLKKYGMVLEIGKNNSAQPGAEADLAFGQGSSPAQPAKRFTHQLGSQ